MICTCGHLFHQTQDLPDTNSLVTSLYLEVSKQEAIVVKKEGESRGNPLWLCAVWLLYISVLCCHCCIPHLILAGLQQWFLCTGCLPAAPASAKGHADAAVAGRRTISQRTHKKLILSTNHRKFIVLMIYICLSAHFCIDC